MTREFVFDKTTVAGKHCYTPEAGLKSTFTVKTSGGKRFKVTTLTREQALNACKVDGKLLITSSMVLPEAGRVRLLNLGDPVFRYVEYPSAKGFKEQMKEVPIEKLIKETNGLIRAAAYKKRIEVQNKENYEAGLEAVQSMVFETMAKDDPELYHRVSAYLNKKKSEGMEG